ncbi:hypothetical protein B9G55_17300 [Saccharibacillus sp. O16]|nr:hypothetical protein B9G55_17300 [Saccharibacillus sp. O16]
MNTRKLRMGITGTAALLVIGYALYQAISGQGVGNSEIYSIGFVLALFLSAATWGHKGEDDGVRQDEELGRRITEKSGLIGYYVLLALLLIAVIGEQALQGTTPISLLILLAIGVCLHPLIEFLQVRKYR